MTFYIATDDLGKLYLSSDSSAGSKTEIAYQNNWSGVREWTKYGSQKSVQIHLEAGEAYYLEAIMVENGGGDNLAVGWITPTSGGTISVIPGQHLRKYSPGTTAGLVAQNDVVQTRDSKDVTTQDVMYNDFEKIGGGFTLKSFTEPDLGSVVYNGDGTFTYMPVEGFVGSGYVYLYDRFWSPKRLVLQRL